VSKQFATITGWRKYVFNAVLKGPTVSSACKCHVEYSEQSSPNTMHMLMADANAT